MRRAEISRKNWDLGIQIEKNLIKKNVFFSKFWKINDDVKATQSIFLGMNFGGGAGWPGWLAWLAGWCVGCRFLVLIIKVMTGWRSVAESTKTLQLYASLGLGGKNLKLNSKFRKWKFRAPVPAAGSGFKFRSACGSPAVCPCRLPLPSGCRVCSE